ncbi:MAG: hypothetical protein M1828_005237 [Chrysothrix sp. TS-e1954]|nr:MAG: hypothetical protein M1828_005237 [Chrysothrix sp. TS-e1954]
MAEQFKGLRLRVTLKPPRAWVMYGLVTDITPDSDLHLSNVSFDTSAQVLDHVAVPGTEVADLEVLPEKQVTIPTHPKLNEPRGPQHEDRSCLRQAQVPLQNTSTVPTKTSTQLQNHFLDPAILSYEKRLPNGAASHGAPARGKETLPTKTPVSPNQAYQFENTLHKTSLRSSSLHTTTEPNNGKPEVAVVSPLIQTVTGASKGPQSNQDHDVRTQFGKKQNIAVPHVQAEDTQSTRASRRKNKKRQQASISTVFDSSPELARAPTTSGQVLPNEWRKTPILEEHPSQNASHQLERQPQHLPRKTRRPRKTEDAKKDGWATEEATDVQCMDEFDFTGSLSKFDKKAVFDQIKQQDTTADEDRLVSYNTMRKLLPSENVLGTSYKQASNGLVESEADDNTSKMVRSISSRSSLKRGKKKASVPSESSTSHARPKPSHIQRSLSPSTRWQDQVAVRPSSLAPSSNPTAYFRHPVTDREVPYFDAELIRNAEDYAINEFFLSSDILHENAGRAIAEVALAFLTRAAQNRSKGHVEKGSKDITVLMLLGENRASGRALVAGRYMIERGLDEPSATLTVVASFTDFPPASDYRQPATDPWSTEPHMHRYPGVHIPWHEVPAFVKGLKQPPDLVIDALIGTNLALCEVANTSPQLANSRCIVNQIISSSAGYLAVGIPVSTHPGDGFFNTHDRKALAVRDGMVVCPGAITKSLRNMMIARRECTGPTWQVYVVDIGIQTALAETTSTSHSSWTAKDEFRSVSSFKADYIEAA